MSPSLPCDSGLYTEQTDSRQLWMAAWKSAESDPEPKVVVLVPCSSCCRFNFAAPIPRVTLFRPPPELNSAQLLGASSQPPKISFLLPFVLDGRCTDICPGDNCPGDNCPGNNCPGATTVQVRQLSRCDNCPGTTTVQVRQLSRYVMGHFPVEPP